MSEPRSVRPRRSLLFVPALRPDRYLKALDSGADIVCIDLEDATPLDRKDEGRATALPLFAQPAPAGVEPMARINALSTYHGLKDLQALVESPAPPPAIMIPKVKSAEEVQLIDSLLSAGAARHIRFCVIIETNQGLERAMDIARASPRIDAMILGAVDLSAELRCQKSWEPLLYARSRLVHAAAGAGIDLLDVPWLNLDDPDGLAREAAACAAMGFTGKASIHPKQIGVINTAFSPTAAQVDKARRVVQAYETSTTGLVVVDGELIELPVVRSYYRMLAIAERISGNAAA